MTDVGELSELQLDVLREVGNIGAAHAATALSTMTALTTAISMPEVSTIALSSASELLLSGTKGRAVTLVMRILGDLTGRILLLFREDDAEALCDLLLRAPPGTTVGIEDLEESALLETANIVGGASMKALSDLLKMMLLTSIPKLIIDEVEDVFTTSRLNLDDDVKSVMWIKTDFEFQDQGRTLPAQFLLMPDTASISAIFDALHVT